MTLRPEDIRLVVRRIPVVPAIRKAQYNIDHAEGLSLNNMHPEDRENTIEITRKLEQEMTQHFLYGDNKGLMPPRVEPEPFTAKTTFTDTHANTSIRKEPMTSARILADSVSPDGIRLTTMECTFPRFILAELNTHRMFSRNSASSRAIPPERHIERVRHEPFMPEFNHRVKGMGVGEVLDALEQMEARAAWLAACDAAVQCAEQLVDLDVDKSRVNRILEPFMWHTAIVSSSRWSNFFALRDHPAAQPEFRVLAQHMRYALENSVPAVLQYDDWHLPLTTADEQQSLELQTLANVSAGRCARVSFDTHTDYEPLEASLERAERLKTSGHWSPFEHQAQCTKTPITSNFHGDWTQHRKMYHSEDDFSTIK